MYWNMLVVLNERCAKQVAVHEAIALARLHDATLHFLYPVTTSDVVTLDLAPIAMELQSTCVQERILQANDTLGSARRLAEQFGLVSRSLLAKERDQLAQVLEVIKQRRCDLVVIGMEPSNAVQRLFNGSLIPGLISRSPAPVLVCRDSPYLPSLRRQELEPMQARQRRLARVEAHMREYND